MLLATFFFSLMNVFIKQLAHIPAMEIVFFRCLISLFICIYGIRQAGYDWKGNNKTELILRGVFGTIALFCFFLTIQNAPLASAVTLQYLSPIFTTLIAVFFLKEKVKFWQWLCYLSAFGGVLVIKGYDSRIQLLYLFTGIISGLFSALAYNMVRSLQGKEPTLVVVLHFQIVGVIAGFIITLFDWVLPTNIWDWIYLFAIGLTTHLGQVHLTKALHYEKASNVSILIYSGLIYALFFGYFVFGETYSSEVFLGILIVVISVIVSVLLKKKSEKPAMLDETTTG